MLPGQMLHGQMSLGHLSCAMYGPTNLTLKLREAEGSKTTFPAVGWVGGWVARQNGNKAKLSLI